MRSKDVYSSVSRPTHSSCNCLAGASQPSEVNERSRDGCSTHLIALLSSQGVLAQPFSLSCIIVPLLCALVFVLLFAKLLLVFLGRGRSTLFSAEWLLAPHN